MGRKIDMRSRGFGIIELLVSLVVMSFLLLGAYRILTKTQTASTNVVQDSSLLRQAAQLENKLGRDLRNLGYNPLLTSYAINPPLYPDGTGYLPDDWTTWDPYRAEKRIGITLALPTKIEFTSDDEATPNGIVDQDQIYSFWLGSAADPFDDTMAQQILGELREKTRLYDESRVTDGPPKVPVEAGWTRPCTAREGQALTGTWTLYGLAKDGASGGATVPIVLAPNVACFEIRYLNWEVKDNNKPGKGTWLQLIHDDDYAANASTRFAGLKAKYIARHERPGFLSGPPDNWTATPHATRSFSDATSERKYFGGDGAPFRNTTADFFYVGGATLYGLTHIHKLQVGFVLVGQEQRVNDKVVRPTLHYTFEIQLGNWPWSRSLLASRQPSN